MEHHDASMEQQPIPSAPVTKTARGGVTILCFLAVILGQAWLLRNILLAGALPLPYYVEMGFCLLLAVGIVICLVRPVGWGGTVGCGLALLLFLIYAVFTIRNYHLFLTGYLTGFEATYESSGGGFVGLKLVLVLVGITAGIPVAPRIDDREYARRLREKVQKQDAEWAMAAARGARKDLNATVEKLRSSLSKEELAELLAELQSDIAPADSGREADSGEEKEESAAERARGWGGGM
ncbi:MAG: hypothetical protein LUE86_13305 [Clostridiales bacterium]|nr:hypothetical protein [Clostridiales bacterium]